MQKYIVVQIKYIREIIQKKDKSLAFFIQSILLAIYSNTNIFIIYLNALLIYIWNGKQLPQWLLNNAVKC